MGRRRTILGRELHGIFGEKTFLLAIAIQVFVAGFSSFLVVGLATIFDPSAAGTSASSTIALHGDSGFADVLEEQGLTVRPVDDPGVGLRMVGTGAADAFVEVSDEPPDGEDPIIVEITVPEGRLATSLTVVQLREALKTYESQLRDARSDRIIVQPIEVTAEARPAPFFEFVYTLLVPLLLFLPPFLAGALVADSITEEVQRGSLPVLLSTPASLTEVVEGKMLANVVMAPLLGGAWIMLLEANGIHVAAPHWVLLLVTGVALLFCVTGALVALLTRERNQAQVVYAALLLVLLLLGNLLPVSPVNATARLAAGSGDLASILNAAGVAVAGVLVHLGLRVFLRRYGNELAEAGPPSGGPVSSKAF